MAKRPPRKFTVPQVQRRLKAIKLELAAIVGAYNLERGEIRSRVLTLYGAVQELLDRWPTTPE